MKTNVDFATALRALADLYETNDAMPRPFWGQEYYGGLTVNTYSAEEFKVAAIALKSNGIKKEYTNSSMTLRSNVGGLPFSVSVARDTVCEKKVLGMKQVPERVHPGTAAYVEPAHEEEIVSWDCKKSLLGPDEDDANMSQSVGALE